MDGYGQGPYGGESSSSLAPTDPDGDGKYEDLNGNGKVDYDDIVVFFKNLYEPAITENESDFDFNGNGRVDYDDFVALLEEV